MFSLFANNKNPPLKPPEEEKIDKGLSLAIEQPSENPRMDFPRISRSEMEKQVLLKRRRDPELSIELSEFSYKKRLTNMKTAISQRSFLHESNEFSCPICMDTIISANTTVCGHTFCEQCLLETLLLNSGCPLCRTPLRTFQMTFSKALDQIVEKCVVQSANRETIANFEKRKKEHEKWDQSRKIGDVSEGDELDVRDTEYIWCIGIVMRKITKQNKPTIYLIHYQYLLHPSTQDVMYGYVVIGNREQLSNGLPQAQNLLIIQNAIPPVNVPANNLNESVSNDEPSNVNSMRRMSRVGANLAVPAENNEGGSREEGHDSITVVSNVNEGARENEEAENERNLDLKNLISQTVIFHENFKLANKSLSYLCFDKKNEYLLLSAQENGKNKLIIRKIQGVSMKNPIISKERIIFLCPMQPDQFFLISSSFKSFIYSVENDNIREVSNLKSDGSLKSLKLSNPPKKAIFNGENRLFIQFDENSIAVIDTESEERTRLIKKKFGEILDFGLLKPQFLLILFRSKNELRFEGYDAEGAQGEPGVISEDIYSFKIERISMKNVECLSEMGNPFTLALVLQRERSENQVVEKESENLEIWLFKNDFSGGIKPAVFRFFITDLHSYEYVSIEKPIFPPKSGNELDFIGLKHPSQPVFKTLILRDQDNLESILNSDTQKFELFDPSFMINPDYLEMIKESLPDRRKSIFQEDDEENENEIVLDFLRDLIKKERHFYIIELIKRRVLINGEEKYLILELERVKDALEQIFEGKKEEFFKELDEFHSLDEEVLASMHEVLFRIKQVFEALIYRKNEEAIRNKLDNLREDFFDQDQDLLSLYADSLTQIENLEHYFKILIFLTSNGIPTLYGSFLPRLRDIWSERREKLQTYRDQDFGKSLNPLNKTLLYSKPDFFIDFLVAKYPCSFIEILGEIRNEDIFIMNLMVFYILNDLIYCDPQNLREMLGELRQKFVNTFNIDQNWQIPIFTGFTMMDSLCDCLQNEETKREISEKSRKIAFKLSSNAFFPEKWKLFALKTLALFGSQTETLILSSTLDISWKKPENAKFQVFLWLRSRNLLQAYAFLQELADSAELFEQINEFFTLIFSPIEEALLDKILQQPADGKEDQPLPKSAPRAHFLFLYYLMANQLEKACEIFPAISLEKPKLATLLVLLKSRIENLPDFEITEYRRNYPFLDKPFEGGGGEFSGIEEKERFKPGKMDFGRFREGEEEMTAERPEVREEEIRGERKSKNRHDFEFSSKVPGRIG